MENKIKIVTVIGARPQFIKAACVSRKIKEFDKIGETIIHTGQHYDYGMSEIFFKDLEIPEPKYNLGISSLSQGAMVGKMVEKIEEILISESPDMILLYGDTNSTLAGALAGVKLHLPVAHVEAGLRSFNNRMPEEINRILTDRISSLLFAPTDTAVENLKNEGFEIFEAEIIRSGDVMFDSVLYNSKKEKTPDIDLPDEFILATLHRPETTDKLENLVNCITVLQDHTGFPVVLSLHPRTEKVIRKNNLSIDSNNLIIIEPVSYFEMLYLLKRCRLVATDSGGLQKEAFFFNKYCLTLREESEWTELVENGFNIVSGYKINNIIESLNSLLSKDPFESAKHDYYGKGNASSIIVDKISDFINSTGTEQ